jgi:6-pyruvoyltetrahydropterin/6-carboxytetrahydropterin synthase
MIRLTRVYKFSASHRLHSPSLSVEVNRAIYGKCNNPYGHGHNYLLAVSVLGPLDSKSGRVADPRALDRLVREEILSAFDHKNLNIDVPEFADGKMVPTSECLLQVIQNRLEQAWLREFPTGWPAFERVHLEETKNNKFDLAVPAHISPRVKSYEEIEQSCR